MIDSEKVETQLTAMIADLKPYCEGTAPNNVLSRMQAEVIPELIRWKTREMNRGVDRNSVLNAFVALVSSQMVSIVGEVVGTVDVSDDHFVLANSMLQAIGEEIGSIMSGERQMQQYSIPAERTP